MVMMDVLMLMVLMVGMVRLQVHADGRRGRGGCVTELGRWCQNYHTGAFRQTVPGHRNTTNACLQRMGPRVGFIGIGFDRRW
uniref:Putative secreted protein n=1 Tax=Anopheles triannulatus TaxID=58253 RepID=A0A2M4B174_9DIPT